MLATQFFDEAAKKLTANDPDIICTRAQLQARQAWFTALIGLPDQGLLLAQDSVNVLRQFRMQDITAETLSCVNINALYLNKRDIVAQIGQEMAKRVNQSSDLWERGWATLWQAYALVLQGQFAKALQVGQEPLAIYEKLDNTIGLSIVPGMIFGTTAVAIGDLGTAKPHFLRGMQAAEELNFLHMLRMACDFLGTIALSENAIEQAQHHILRGLRISHECGQPREMLAYLRDFAKVYIAQGNLEDALQLLAVVLNHPASDQNLPNRPGFLRDDAEKLRAQIESQLDPPLYQSAWERGQRQRLVDVVTQLLN